MDIEEIKIGMILKSKKTNRIVLVLEINKDEQLIECLCFQDKKIHILNPVVYEISEIKEW